MHFGMPYLWFSVDDFWSIWSRSAEEGLLRAFSQAGGPTEAGSSAFLGRGLLRIRSRRLGVRAAGGTKLEAGYVVFVIMMRFISIALSILSIPLFLLYHSFVGVLSPKLMFLKVSGTRGSLSLGWDALLRYWGSCMSSWSRVVLFILGMVGSPRSSWFL